MLSPNARTRKCNRIFKFHSHFMREKIAKMTDKQLKKYTLKKRKECLKNPRLNKISVKKLKADLDRFDKALYERFPNE
jgi:hypothetical protein